MKILVSLVIVFVTGCATLPQVGQSGSVTVILGTPISIARSCAQITNIETARGCSVWQMILCPFNDVECLAHEIRHLLDPSWDHTENKR